MTLASMIASAAHAEPRDAPRALLSLGALAGPENPPGVVLLVEAGVGLRITAAMTWHLRPAWAPFTSEWGGGSGSVSSQLMEARTGPTWWSCGVVTCAGVTTEVGLQYLRTDVRGDEGNGPFELRRRDYLIVTDVRVRILGPTSSPIRVEASLGFRIKASVHSSGHVPNESSGGGGLLLGLAVVGAL